VNARSLKALEYPKIIAMLESKATTAYGKELAAALLPTTKLELATAWQSDTREGLELYRLSGGVSLGGVKELRPALIRLDKAGVLTIEQLLDIANTIYAGNRVKRTLTNFAQVDLIPHLYELAEQLSELKELEKTIRTAIDENGEIKDTATPELKRIRQQISAAESKLKTKLEALIKSPTNQSKLQDPIITIRNDRYVIPVKQEYRGFFGGIIHDQSASGATLYIEPEAVVEINNQLREALLKEQREIERILIQLSGEAMAEAGALELNVALLAEIDFIQAKAELAREMNATKPLLNAEGKLSLKRARHPLIPPDQVVPIDVELGIDYRAIIITGPNTGGKTVSLKTIGLLTLMAMAGLHLPVTEGSRASTYSAVYVDIGDEQSIEQSLSTFSGHMTNIIKILAEFDENSLILLDELGAGTDPTEGAGLAIALLEHIKGVGASVVATTHYSELKAYAYNSPGIINASVEFDVESLRPTYRLLIGAPGRSNAFLIAERLGLSKDLIAMAKDQVRQDDRQVESMIAILEANRLAAEKERAAAEELRVAAAKTSNELAERLKRLEAEQETILTKAEKEAEQLVAKAQKTADTIINELRQLALAEQSSIKEHQLIELKKGLKDAVLERGLKGTSVGAKPQQKLKVGDDVLVHSFGQKGTIIEQVADRQYLVQIGLVKVNVNADELELLATKKESKPQQSGTSFKRSSTARPEIDLRGKNIEESITELDIYLDEAFLQGYGQVTVIHGVGTGALRAGLQDFLKRHPHTKETRPGRYGEGGSGVTIVQFK